jgi:hypothetical protein
MSFSVDATYYYFVAYSSMAVAAALLGTGLFKWRKRRLATASASANHQNKVAQEFGEATGHFEMIGDSVTV